MGNWPFEIFNDGGIGNGDANVHDQCVFYLPSVFLKFLLVVLTVFFYLHRCAKAEGQQTVRLECLLIRFVVFVLDLHPWHQA